MFYGLLKQGAVGQPADLPLATAGVFGAPCRFRGRMVDLGGFPGVVEGDDLCRGIRWQLADTVIVALMDAFEDVTDDPATSLYIRRRIPLRDDSGQETGETAWIYWYNQPVDRFPAVANGDWPLDAGRTRK
ncbi:MAG: gamma-glutamylcyclotransferase family protein [Hyphomonas sp.]